MKSILIGVAVIAALLVIVFVDYTPSALVIVPEVKSVPKVEEGYYRPVREGNCWRQFIGKGTKDSVLVCG
jgi:hypothetical protein